MLARWKSFFSLSDCLRNTCDDDVVVVVLALLLLPLLLLPLPVMAFVHFTVHSQRCFSTTKTSFARLISYFLSFFLSFFLALSLIPPSLTRGKHNWTTERRWVIFSFCKSSLDKKGVSAIAQVIERHNIPTLFFFSFSSFSNRHNTFYNKIM